MVSHYAHSHIHFVVFAIFSTTNFAYSLQKWLEYVGIVVWSFALYSHAKTLKAHTCVDYFVRKWLERTISFAVVLHEHVVPNLNHLWVVAIHKVATIDLCALCIWTKVDMNFRTRTTRTCIAHFPEVIFFVTIDNAINSNIFSPNVGSFVIAFKTFGRRTFEYCNIETVFVEFEHFSKIFPSPSNSLSFEIVAKRPVTQHLKHSVVVSVVTYLFEVVMLTAHAQTFLRVGNTWIFDRVVTQNDVFELIHTCIGKHQCRVTFDDHRCRRYDFMAFRSKKIEERFTNFFWCHFYRYFFKQDLASPSSSLQSIKQACSLLLLWASVLLHSAI